MLVVIQIGIMLKYASLLLVSLLITQCLCKTDVLETGAEYREIRYDMENEIYTQYADDGEVINEDVMVNIGTAEPLSHVEESFISFNEEGGQYILNLTSNMKSVFFR